MILTSDTWIVLAALSTIGLLSLRLALPQSMKLIHWLVAMVLTLALIAIGLVMAPMAGIQPSALAGWLAGNLRINQIIHLLVWAAAAGISVGSFLLVTLYLASRRVLPQLRARFIEEMKFPRWKRVLIAIYSGILEEYIFRLFLLSLAAWLLGLVWQASSGRPNLGILWASNAFASIIFGLVHLPRWSSLTRLSPRLIIALIGMNGLGGLVFGYLFISFGIEAAVIAHILGDMVLHVIGPRFLSI